MFSPRSPDNGTPMRLVSPELSPGEDTQSPPPPGYRTPVPLALGVGPDLHQERFIVALPPLVTVQHGDGTVNGPTRPRNGSARSTTSNNLPQYF